MLADVRAGLSRQQKELSPTWLYDERGIRMFEEITRLPEYYLTRVERQLIEENASSLLAPLVPATLAELGASSESKAKILLSAALRSRQGVTYVPIDISRPALERVAAAVEGECAGVRVRPLVADIRDPFALPTDAPRPLLLAFLGSTIGNFTRREAILLLARMREALLPGDRLLLGADLVKDPAVIEAAYNDSRGITAEFNLNVLRVLNRQLGADFDLSAFEHHAFYDVALRRVEMHLVSRHNQSVRVPGVGVFGFRAGETIRTEISCKYDRSEIEEMFAAAGLLMERWITDERQRFALALGAPRPGE